MWKPFCCVEQMSRTVVPNNSRQSNLTCPTHLPHSNTANHIRQTSLNAKIKKGLPKEAFRIPIAA